MFNKFKNAAESRGIGWQLSVDEMFSGFNEKCALTGWPISIAFSNQTASLDRVDSKQAYTVSNIQWVHKMVNMCKNKYSLNKFIDLCIAVADKSRRDANEL